MYEVVYYKENSKNQESQNYDYSLYGIEYVIIIVFFDITRIGFSVLSQMAKISITKLIIIMMLNTVLEVTVPFFHAYYSLLFVFTRIISDAC